MIYFLQPSLNYTQYQNTRSSPSRQNTDMPDTQSSGQTDHWNSHLADTGVAIPGPPNYNTSKTFHCERNICEDPMPETLAAIFRHPHPDTIYQTPRTFTSWSKYFEHQQAEIEATASTPNIEETRPLQVWSHGSRPWPRPFTPHPVSIEGEESQVDGDPSEQQEMETQISSDTVLNTPKCSMTSLEQMDENNLQQISSIFPLNAELKAAGNEGIPLTQEQHELLNGGGDYSHLYHGNATPVDGNHTICLIPKEHQTIHWICETIHAGIHMSGVAPREESIMDLVQPDDPPILRAFVEELQNWPQLDEMLDEAFGNNK